MGGHDLRHGKGPLSKLRGKFKAQLRDDQRVVCLNIPDDYGYMDNALVTLLQDKVGRYL